MKYPISFLALVLVLSLTLNSAPVLGLLKITEGDNKCINWHVIDSNGNVNDAQVNVTIYHNDTINQTGTAPNIGNGLYCYLSNQTWESSNETWTAQANVTYTDGNVSAGVQYFKIVEEDIDDTVANSFMAGNELVAIIISGLIIWWFLLRHKIMSYRLIGVMGMTTVGATSFVLGETAPFLLLGLIAVLIASIQLFEDVPLLVASRRN